jgi:hypothetical protein
MPALVGGDAQAIPRWPYPQFRPDRRQADILFVVAPPEGRSEAAWLADSPGVGRGEVAAVLHAAHIVAVKKRPEFGSR